MSGEERGPSFCDRTAGILRSALFSSPCGYTGANAASNELARADAEYDIGSIQLRPYFGEA